MTEKPGMRSMGGVAPRRRRGLAWPTGQWRAGRSGSVPATPWRARATREDKPIGMGMVVAGTDVHDTGLPAAMSSLQRS